MLFNLIRKPKYFLIFTGIINILLAVSYVFIYFYQIDAPVTSDRAKLSREEINLIRENYKSLNFKYLESWVNDALIVKKYIADSISDKKIIIIGDSNALLGIDSSVIEQKTGLKVVNLATQGNLSIDYFSYLLKKVITKGDIVVMPIVLDYYCLNHPYSDWLIVNILAWDKEYFHSMSLSDKAKFIWYTPFEKVLEGVYSIATSEKAYDVNEKEVIANFKHISRKQDFKWRGYSYLSLNEYGDMKGIPAIKKRFLNQVIYGEFNDDLKYMCDEIFVSDYIAEQLHEIMDLVNEFNAELYLTWPVTMRSNFFDLRKVSTREKIKKLAEALKEKNIPIYCNPAMFNLDIMFFFDSIYHPNTDGAKIRSFNLAECINNIDNEEFPQNQSYTYAIQKVLNQEYILSNKRY